MGNEPASVRASTLSNMNISKTSGPIDFKFYMKHHWVGERLFSFWARSDRNSSFLGSHRVSIGENLVSTLAPSFLQVRRTTIKSLESLNFSPIRPRIVELAALSV